MNMREKAVYFINRQAFNRASGLLKNWLLSNRDDIYAHKELIWCFYKQGDKDYWERYSAFYDEFYQHHEKDVLAIFAEAEKMFIEEYFEEAIRLYELAIEKNKHSPFLHFRLAQVLVNIRNYNEAEREFEQSLHIDPELLPAIADFSELLYNEGKFSRLEELLYATIQRKKSFYLKYVSVNDIFERLEELKNVIDKLSTAISLANRNKTFEAAMTLWTVFQQHGNNCSIIRTMVYLIYLNNWMPIASKRIVDKYSDDEKAFRHYAQGLVFWYDDKVDEALNEYDNSINAGLDHPLLFGAMALAQEFKNQFIDEQQSLLRAFKRQPWLMAIRNELVGNAIDKENCKAALRLSNLNKSEVEQAIKYEIDAPRRISQMQQIRIKVLIKMGSIENAALFAESGKEIIVNEMLHMNKALIYIESCQWEKAINELAAAIDLSAETIAHLGETEINTIEKSLKNDLNCFEAKFIIALHPAYQGDLSKSIQRLLQLESEYPNSAKTAYHLSNMFYHIGRMSEAKAYCKKAISIDSADKKAFKLMCFILKEERDGLKKLLELAKEYPTETAPLETALDIAILNQIQELPIKISRMLLSIDPNNGLALNIILHGTEEDSNEWIDVLEKTNKKIPLNFEARQYVAFQNLKRGRIKESLIKYKELLEDGNLALSNILNYGLAILEVNKNNMECK